MTHLALVIILGKSAETLARVINKFRPEMICYLMYDEGLPIMHELLCLIAERPAIDRKVVVTDYQDLLACYEAAERCLEATRKEGFGLKNTVVDLSGGVVPSMIAGMVAAGAPWGYRFHVLKDPSKWGSGPYPLYRREEDAYLHQKYNRQIFFAELKLAALLFNRAQFTGARLLLEDLFPRVEAPEQFFVKALAAIARGYEAWDFFAYARAREEMAKGVAALDWYHAIQPERWQPGEGEEATTVLTVFARGVKENIKFLSTLTTEGQSEDRSFRLRVIDLLAHAEHRLAVGAYADALTRLYRATGLVIRQGRSKEPPAGSEEDRG
ncbi:MAG: hypothetical protein GX493_01790, partial [Firmicutes bacterium]|nr:hypothetical protein [Bacillota bacterium]